jgi:uroporphyrinogen-III synthase
VNPPTSRAFVIEDRLNALAFRSPNAVEYWTNELVEEWRESIRRVEVDAVRHLRTVDR